VLVVVCLMFSSMALWTALNGFLNSLGPEWDDQFKRLPEPIITALKSQLFAMPPPDFKPTMSIFDKSYVQSAYERLNELRPPPSGSNNNVRRLFEGISPHDDPQGKNALAKALALIEALDNEAVRDGSGDFQADADQRRL